MDVAARVSSPVETRARIPLAEWAVCGLLAVLAAYFTLHSLPIVVLLTVVPLAVWLVRTYPTLIIWALSLEVTLGGWGHVFDIGGLPIRHLLFFLTMAVWAFNKMIDGDLQLRGGIFAWAAGALLSCVLVSVLWSAAHGAPAAFEDGLTPVFLLLLFPFADIAARPGGSVWLLRTFLVAVLLCALVEVLVTIAIPAGLLEPHAMAILFNQRFGGLLYLSGRFYRVFIVGAVFFQIVIVLLLAVRFARAQIMTRGIDLAILLITSLALLLTFTRGFWLTTVIGLVVLWFITTSAGRAKWLGGALAGVLVLVVGLQFFAPQFLQVFVNRFMLLFNPDRDISVAWRLDMYPRLMARIAERPFFGFGFGVPVLGQLYFENSYFYYLIKFGAFGLAVLLAGWALLIYAGLHLSRHARTRSTRGIAVGLVAGVIAMLATTSINPFINSAVGFYFQALTGAVLYGLGLEDQRARLAAGDGVLDPER